ncbi:hypothetical protein [Vampirovibrio chlorellavorus]|uniref:hypothetical protein n=1 Tax=Vampirovibrio chlorellavorus TaxID=758823 RepID=UPI0026ECA54B|nr:hypothetical protein [Vampirovibrio chlorellavorus]
MTKVSPVHSIASNAAQVLKQSKLAQTLAFQEGQGGGTAMKFLQDTGTAWMPKILISRSKAEGAEVSLLEFGESAMTYALPTLLGPGLASLFFRAAGKSEGFRKQLLTQTFEQLKHEGNAQAVHRAMAAKAGMILTTIGGIGLWGESLVNYGKNLMTAKVFKKNTFSDVINLNPETASTASDAKAIDESPQVRKARRRIVQATAAFGGIVGSSVLLARFGHRFGWSKALSQKMVKHLDFDFAHKEGGKVAFGLGNRKGLLGAIMLTCAIPYLDSARDGYERLETAIRLPVVFAYILYGQEFVQKLMFKNFPGLFKGALDDKNQLLSTQQIAQNAVQGHWKEGQAWSSDIQQKILQDMKRPMVSKAMTVAFPLLSGVFVTGIGLGLFNRLLTAHRFKKQAQQQPAVPAAGMTAASEMSSAPATPSLTPSARSFGFSAASQPWSNHPANPGFTGFQTLTAPLSLPAPIQQSVVTPVAYR